MLLLLLLLLLLLTCHVSRVRLNNCIHWQCVTRVQELEEEGLGAFSQLQEQMGMVMQQV
jgi:hypothetical protein